MERNIRLLLSLQLGEVIVVLGEDGRRIEEFLRKKFKGEFTKGEIDY